MPGRTVGRPRGDRAWTQYRSSTGARPMTWQAPPGGGAPAWGRGVEHSGLQSSPAPSLSRLSISP